MDQIPGSKDYEAPALTVLGSVHALTQGPINKMYGTSDGFLFLDAPITNASP